MPSTLNGLMILANLLEACVGGRSSVEAVLVKQLIHMRLLWIVRSDSRPLCNGIALLLRSKVLPLRRDCSVSMSDVSTRALHDAPSHAINVSEGSSEPTWRSC